MRGPWTKTRAQPLQVKLVDRNSAIVDAWTRAFAEEKAVSVGIADLLHAKANAILCPANSFGDMSGGIDRAIDLHFDRKAQPAVVAAIRERCLGELPVGMALIVTVPDQRKRLIVAPTMRIPGSVKGTINAYLAFRAALVAVQLHNVESESVIRSIVSPGLCTGVGGMDPATAAAQMLAAYRNVIHGYWKQVEHPAMAPFAMA